MEMEQTIPEAFRQLDTAEACAALRISRSTLQKRLKDGLIRRSGACVGRNLFPIEEIHRLIGTQRAEVS
jgi:predicted site-specific integrase-resolvase